MYENEKMQMNGLSAPKEPSPLENRFHDLTSALEELSKVIAYLGNKTQPVRYPVPTEPETARNIRNEISAVSSMSPVEDRVHSAEKTVQNLISNVNAIVGELRI